MMDVEYSFHAKMPKFVRTRRANSTSMICPQLTRGSESKAALRSAIVTRRSSLLPKAERISCLEYPPRLRSEEHTSELQSLMRISYAVFCLKKNTTKSLQPSTERKIDRIHYITHKYQN